MKRISLKQRRRSKSRQRRQSQRHKQRHQQVAVSMVHLRGPVLCRSLHLSTKAVLEDVHSFLLASSTAPDRSSYRETAVGSPTA